MAMIVYFVATSALATHVGGGRYDVVGFSRDGSVVVRQVDEQFGTVRVAVLALDDASELESVPIAPADDPTRVIADVLERHNAIAPGVPGSMSPARDAMVLVLPGPLKRGKKPGFNYQIVLVDAEGSTTLRTFKVRTACPPSDVAHARLHVTWSPDGTAVVIAGAILVERRCGEPTLVPFVRIAEVTDEQGTIELAASIATLNTAIQRLAATRPGEAKALAETAVAVQSGAPEPLLTLARLRAQTGDLRGAIATLWALRALGLARDNVSGSDDAFAVWRRAMALRWPQDMTDRAAFVALTFESTEH